MKLEFNKTSSSLRILVLGYLVRGPMGGMAWHHLQYLMGLRKLGHDAWFLEDSGDSEYCCYDPSRNTTDTDPSYGLRFADACFKRLNLSDYWAYHDAHRQQWHGPATGQIKELIQSADLLVNLSCSHCVRPWFNDIPVRALIDTDPLFTQIRNLTDPDRKQLAQRHNRFFSFAGNIGTENCAIPEDGFDWKPTRQPILLEAWPLMPALPDAKLSTVMQWDSYKPIEYQGRHYGMKSESFSNFQDLPARSHAKFELAMGGTTAPRAQLRKQGWFLHNPNEVAATPWDYQQFIQQSLGEFTVAKEGYVRSRSGWFSERSAAYLASGRPVVTQETGFTDWLPCGSGLHAFQSIDEAIDACDTVYSDYKNQSTSARRIAEEYFDALKVLPPLVDEIMNQSPESSTCASLHHVD